MQTLQIGAYAARLAGVRSGRIATSISLFNLFVTASRLANLFYAPLLGTLADAAAESVRVSGSSTAGPGAAAATQFEWQVRAIIFAGTIGTTLGALLLPLFFTLFMRGIRSFERTASLPRALLRLFDYRVVWSLVPAIRLPAPSIVREFSISHVPVKLLVSNVIVTAIYAIGVVAAYEASVIDIHARGTAIALSGIINGFATITFTLIVDPGSAFIIDQAVKGERPVRDVRSLVFFLSLTAIIGTLVSQLILTPAADVITLVAQWYAK